MRRSRIVIKPNIKPTLPKPSSSQGKDASSKTGGGSEASPLVKTPSKGSETPVKAASNKVTNPGSPSKAVKGSKSPVKSPTTSVTTVPLPVKDVSEPVEPSVGEVRESTKDVRAESGLQGHQSSTSVSPKFEDQSQDSKQNSDEVVKIEQEQLAKEKKAPPRPSRRSRIAIKPNIKPKPAVAKSGASMCKPSPVTPAPQTSGDVAAETPSKPDVPLDAEKSVAVEEEKDIFKNVKTTPFMTPIVVPSSPPSSPPPAEVPPTNVKPVVSDVLPDSISLSDKDCEGSVTGDSCDITSVAGESVAGEAGDDGVEDEKESKKKIRRKTKKPEVEQQHSREKSPDRQKMKMGDLLFWNPNQNSLPEKAKKNLKKEKELESSVMTTEKAAIDVDHEIADDEDSNESASLPAPQIMIGPDGNIIINMDSTMIKHDKRETTVAVVEDDSDRYLNSNSYRTTKKASVWTETETEMWFLGLSMCGTDFSLLTNLLPHRSRRDLKNKFRREEKKNRPLIDKALANHMKYDPEPFEFMKNPKEKPDKKPVIKREKKEKLAKLSETKKVEGTAEITKIKKEKIQKAQKRKKKKAKESEDEEDDWGPEYDEDFELVDDEPPEVATPSPAKRSKKDVKSESPATLDDSSAPSTPSLPRVKTGEVTRTYSKSQPVAGQPVCESPTTVAGGGEPPSPVSEVSDTTDKTSDSSSSGIQSIPGSTQVQIEMEGNEKPVQGVLIPYSMVPTIAPQLGIHQVTTGMQVLLVQEETDSGSLVHVYIIPEGTQPSAAVPGASGMRPHPPAQSPRHGGQSPAGRSPGRASPAMQSGSRGASPAVHDSYRGTSPAMQGTSRSASPAMQGASPAMQGSSRGASPAMHGAYSQASPASYSSPPAGSSSPARQSMHGHHSDTSQAHHRHVSPATNTSTAMQNHLNRVNRSAYQANNTSPAMQGYSNRGISPTHSASPANPGVSPAMRGHGVHQASPAGHNYPGRRNSPSTQDPSQRLQNSAASNIHHSSPIRQQLLGTPNVINTQNRTPHRSPIANVPLPLTSSMPPPLTPIKDLNSHAHHTHSHTQSPHMRSTHHQTSRSQVGAPRRPPPPLVHLDAPGILPQSHTHIQPAPADSTPPTPSSNLVEMQPVRALPPSQSQRGLATSQPPPRLDLVKEMNKSGSPR